MKDSGSALGVRDGFMESEGVLFERAWSEEKLVSALGKGDGRSEERSGDRSVGSPRVGNGGGTLGL